MWPYVLVAGLATACYTNALFGEFVHDDVVAVSRNPDVLGSSSVYQLLTNDFWGTPLADPRSHKSYRPLTTLTFRLNYWLCGLQPAWYHGLNIALHVACCLLFTRVALVVAGLQARFATVAGLLFAAHPIHTEGVAGIVGRADVLACFLFLLSFLIYHEMHPCSSEGWRLPGVGGGGGKVTCSCLMAALSMLAKETGLTVLLVNLGYDLYKSWPHVKRAAAEARWNEESLQFARRTAKILVATSMLLTFRLAMLQGSLPKFSSQDNPAAFHPCPYVRLLTFCYLAAFNWWLLVCPSTLSHDWQMGSIPLVTSLADCRNLTTALFLTCCVLIAYRCAADFEAQRHAPLVLAGLLLAAPFLPATNLLFTVGFVVAERVLYMPSLGGVLLVGYGAQLLHRWSSPRHRHVLLLGLLLLLASFSGRTFLRNNDWETRESLVRAGIKSLPHNAKMHYNLANYLRDSNAPHLAISHYQEAIKLWPGYASAHNNLGTLMSSPAEAESHFLSAITTSPAHVNAHYNLGQVYRKMNRTMEAVAMLEKCLRLDTSYSPAYLVLAKLRTPPIAARLLYHVTQLLPHSPDYQAYFATWLHERGMPRLALMFYLRALRLQNNHLAATLGVARCLRAQGQIARLHQFLIRWYLMNRRHSGSGRLVHVAELYVRSWDLYKPGQTTAHHVYQHSVTTPPSSFDSHKMIDTTAVRRARLTGRDGGAPWDRLIKQRVLVEVNRTPAAAAATRRSGTWRVTAKVRAWSRAASAWNPRCQTRPSPAASQGHRTLGSTKSCDCDIDSSLVSSLSAVTSQITGIESPLNTSRH